MKFTLSPKERDLLTTACQRIACLPLPERRQRLKDYCPIIEEIGNGGYELFVPESKRVAVLTLAATLERMSSVVAQELATRMRVRVCGVNPCV